MIVDFGGPGSIRLGMAAPYTRFVDVHDDALARRARMSSGNRQHLCHIIPTGTRSRFHRPVERDMSVRLASFTACDTWSQSTSIPPAW